MTRRLALPLFLLALLAAAAGWWWAERRGAEPLRIGVLHSLSGTMAQSETPLVDAVRLAVEEIDAAGGLLGRPLEMVVADGASDPTTFAHEAARLIDEERVAALFGCWTSASRKAVKPVVEGRGHLLFYPVQYEGLELSPNIVYTGAAPNQQIVPAVRWALEKLGRRVYLVGSGYLFPRAANAIIRDLVVSGGGEVVGERYLPLGSRAVEGVTAEIERLHPDAILNTVNGDTNRALFHALAQLRRGPDDLPLLSFSVAEQELAGMAAEAAGSYLAWDYFQGVDTPENRAFVARFKRRFGTDRVTSDPIEAAYVAVRLWAQAVTEAGSAAPAEVLRAVVRQSLAAPEGIVSVDPATRHIWRTVRIGRARGDGQVELLWSSPQPVRPLPFPSYRTPAEWRTVLAALERAGGEAR